MNARSNGTVGEGAARLRIAMITNAENRLRIGEVSLGRLYDEAGLPAPRVARSLKIATDEAAHALKCGRFAARLMSRLAISSRSGRLSRSVGKPLQAIVSSGRVPSDGVEDTDMLR